MTTTSMMMSAGAPRRRRRRRLSAGLAGLAMMVAVGLAAPPANAATAGQMGPIAMSYGDVIYNYDFTTTTNASWKTVDWATSLLFYNNASVNSVKSIAQSRGYGYFGGPMYGYMIDAYGSNAQGATYDSDRGVKTGPPLCLNNTRHSRIYAPPNTDTMYNPAFGFFVFATTHYDHHEGCNAYFDDSEGTEQNLATKFADAGKAVYRSYGYFYNAENQNEGNHHWNNDGYATYIRM